MELTLMKKLVSALSLFLCICLIVPAFPILAAEENKAPEMGSFEEIIASYYDPDGRPMSCAHRAITYIGNPIPENSLAAIQDAIDHKVDIVELDIMRTKDGVYVLCHDNSIKRTTTYTGSLKVSDMTYEAAVLELLKAGFSYYNIAEPMHMEDENASPGVVIKSDPEEGMRVSLDTQVTLIINTYTGEPVDPPVGINPDNNDNNNYN